MRRIYKANSWIEKIYEANRKYTFLSISRIYEVSKSFIKHCIKNKTDSIWYNEFLILPSEEISSQKSRNCMCQFSNFPFSISKSISSCPKCLKHFFFNIQAFSFQFLVAVDIGYNSFSALDDRHKLILQ